ncbi:DUF3025 domain-containing protein [Azoarcus sp. KH32C]|uniref:DUF3025 domain-containing protein n=1 Tax=Azoarcus sp. KH32C TaxID=748247 RepID=UPI0002385E0C|nr:DUF3025 domain-containing protein [Azoarcus sp. KH32C]BAL27191.1 hypothetical protein AZKH_p0308 [Azoarcus sp. KH32C]
MALVSLLPMISIDAAPAAFASRPLFEPIAGLLARFGSRPLPGVDELNRLLDEVAPAATSGSDRTIRFVVPHEDDPAYEERIFATGEVPTRPEDWHDFFNAMAWCVWPRTKATCNALHLAQIAARREAGLPGRGSCRDALTQFDECGIVVVSASPEIPALLAAHRWEEAFWERRGELQATTRFLVFGHGTWDQLRQPFFGLCAKAIYRGVDADWLALSPDEQQVEADRWLAQHLTEQLEDLSPRRLLPLPLLGVPGVTVDNAEREYYRDVRQFRPLREPSLKPRSSAPHDGSGRVRATRTRP